MASGWLQGKQGNESASARKGLSSQKQTVDQRANLIDPDIEKAAASLDEKSVGSTVLAEKRKYHGKDGKQVPRLRHQLTW
jgi:hypothetical protein